MAQLNVSVIGSGVVGTTLADGFLKYGYSVMRGSREPAKLTEWKLKAGAKATIGNFTEAAKTGELIVFAIKGTGAEEALRLCGPENLIGKTIIDTTNPISDIPPVNGVLNYFTSMNESLMERLQKQAPQANFVKCFSSVGSALMVNPKTSPTVPTMFICGNDTGAKSQTKEILNQFGWEAADMGAIEAARAIEPLCRLWCIPGFRENEWSHAFKLLKL